MSNSYPLIIIGSGPAALTASIYLSRSKIQHLILTGSVRGGQLITSTDVENFPGFEAISGYDLMQKIEKHALSFTPNILPQTVTRVDFSYPSLKKIYTNQAEYSAQAILIATGCCYKKLGLGLEDDLLGKGVSYCAICDGNFYRNEEVAVVGGGNVALEDALYLSKLASKVWLIHRRDQFKADQILQDQVKNTNNIHLVLNSTVTQLHQSRPNINDLHSPQLQAVTVTNLANTQSHVVPVSALFVAIGSTPNTQFLQNCLPLDEGGYIVTKPNSTQTAIAGVFAAGDVKEPVFKQAIISAGSGAVAAIEIGKFIRS